MMPSYWEGVFSHLVSAKSQIPSTVQAKWKFHTVVRPDSLKEAGTLILRRIKTHRTHRNSCKLTWEDGKISHTDWAHRP